MEQFFGLAVLVLIGVWATRFFASSIPATSASAIETFKKGLPENFGYPYTLDGTGLAVNVKDQKLLVLVNGHPKIYERGNVRGFRYGMNEANQIYGAKGFSNNVNAGLANRSMKKDVYKSSGIFVELADIDIPVVQIRFSKESELRRSVEVLQQFLDGTLPDYSEYLKRNQ